MAKILINIDDELKAKLREKARSEQRTMTSHIIHIIMRDLDTTEIPLVGKIAPDGTVTFDPGYWNTAEGMKEAAERG